MRNEERPDHQGLVRLPQNRPKPPRPDSMPADSAPTEPPLWEKSWTPQEAKRHSKQRGKEILADTDSAFRFQLDPNATPKQKRRARVLAVVTLLIFLAMGIFLFIERPFWAILWLVSQSSALLLFGYALGSDTRSAVARWCKTGWNWIAGLGTIPLQISNYAMGSAFDEDFNALTDVLALALISGIIFWLPLLAAWGIRQLMVLGPLAPPQRKPSKRKASKGKSPQGKPSQGKPSKGVVPRPG